MAVRPFDLRSLAPACHALAVAAGAVAAWAWGPVHIVAVLHRWLELVRTMAVERNSAAHSLMVADFVVVPADWVRPAMVIVAVECQTNTVHINVLYSLSVKREILKYL